jgi:hypothetical protein
MQRGRAIENAWSDGLGGDLAVWKGSDAGEKRSVGAAPVVGGGSRVSPGGWGPAPRRECAGATRGAATGRKRDQSCDRAHRVASLASSTSLPGQAPVRARSGEG